MKMMTKSTPSIETVDSAKIKRVAVVGFGNIGSGVIELLQKEKQLDLVKIIVKHIDKDRSIPVPKNLITDNVEEVLSDPNIDIIVEVMNDEEQATSILIQALKNGKHVVTANKTVMAESGKEIFLESLKQGRSVGFRGTLVGCYWLLPELSARLQEGRIKNIVAILNGTTNYVLSKMTDIGMDYHEALQEAQQKGYAQPDPTEDISGKDTKNKIKILLGPTNNSVNVPLEIDFKGIDKIEIEDIKYAKDLGLGYVFRLVGVFQKNSKNTFAGVFPVLVKTDSFLGSVKGVNNAIEIEDEFDGVSGFIALGAGKYPTALAIMQDLLEISKDKQFPVPELDEKIILDDIENLSSKFYLRFSVVDRAGVLAQLSGILAKYDISISAVSQKEQNSAECVPVVILVYPTTEKIVSSALEEINKLSIVKEPTKMFRVFEAKDPSQYFPLPT